MGMQKAAVLPVPVWAWPIRSMPASAWGIIPAWMGVGSRYSASSRAANSLSESPMPANPAELGGWDSAVWGGFGCRGGLLWAKIVTCG